MNLPAVPVIATVSLPATNTLTAPMLAALTQALGVPRNVLAADDQIAHAWNNLPRLLDRIPAEHRSETLVRMCVAVATGLFDSAINYAWNAAIIELREKVRRFGLAVVPQVTGKSFDETTLVELKDADLLQLCLKLNLIAEEGFFLLDQCRDIRNNFSAAHPTMGALDETEFLAFLNRCAKHALANELFRTPHSPRYELQRSRVRAYAGALEPLRSAYVAGSDPRPPRRRNRAACP